MTDLLEKFIDFENKHNMFEKEIDGFMYWAYLRFTIFKKIEELNDGQTKFLKSRTMPNLNDIKSLIYNCIIKNPRYYKKRKKILFVTHSRRVQINNKYHCIYTDELAKYFAEECISAEFLFGLKHFSPSYTEDILYLDYVDILPILKLPYLKIKHKNALIKFQLISNEISKMLEEELYVYVNEKIVYDILCRRYLWYKEKKKVLKKIVKSIDPKVIIEVVGYETNKMILNEIAKEEGIATIELQHGVIGKGHLAYNYSSSKLYKFLPDKILLFGNYWKNTFRFPIKDENKIVVGFPYAERQMIEYPHNGNNATQLKIVVLSQPDYSSILINLVSDVVCLLKKYNIDFSLVYKLHPFEYDTSEVKWSRLIEYQEVKIIRDEKNLYKVFSEADSQIGVTSTAIYEGLLYNLDTYIYKIEKSNIYMGDLKRYKGVKFFDNAKTLADSLIVNKHNNSVSLGYSNDFFTNNSLKKIIEVINKELGEISENG